MKLTDEQEAIVSSQSPSIVVLSVAGSGKTTCIEHRVAKKIQQGESPKRMLVMTFSRNMAKELKQKIPDVDWIGTFHSICKRILDEYGHMVGYPKVVLVEEEGYLLKKAMRMSYVKGSQKKIRLLMREYFLTGNTGMHYGFDFFIELYLRYLKDNQIMTYDLLEFYAKEVLKMGIPLRFTSVFIDEFQDTTPIEMEIVKLLSYDSIMVVGDVMQNLYTFRGTTIDNLLLFDGDRLPLSLSFRCPQPIVDVANGIVSQNTFGYSMELKAVKFGVPVSIKTEIDDIPGIVSMYLHKGFRQKEIAILCATNKQVSIVSELLSGFETALNPNYYLRGLAWDVASAFVGMIRDFYMDYAVTRFALLIKIVDQGNIDFLEKYLKDGERLVDKIGSSIAPYLALATRDVPLSKKIELLFEIMGYDRGFGYLKEEAKKARGIVSILQKMEEAEGDAFSLFEDRMCMQDNSDSINILTMHASKGREFPVVILPWWEDGKFPSLLRPMEDLRLAYVAVTRAKEELCIVRTGECKYIA